MEAAREMAPCGPDECLTLFEAIVHSHRAATAVNLSTTVVWVATSSTCATGFTGTRVPWLDTSVGLEHFAAAPEHRQNRCCDCKRNRS